MGDMTSLILTNTQIYLNKPKTLFLNSFLFMSVLEKLTGSYIHYSLPTTRDIESSAICNIDIRGGVLPKTPENIINTTIF